ncbi:L,D-transpeptidase family protein [Tsuneonella sp. HG094]
MDSVTKWIVAALAAIAFGLAAAFATTSVLAASMDKALRAEPIPVDPAALSAKPEKAVAKADDAFTIKRILPINGPIKYGEWHWDDANVPDGPIVITVDLDARVLSVFKGGYEIGAAAVLLGTDEYPTPLGTFPILAKQRHNVSEKYDNAPMPWSMFLTDDGVAIHGGSQVENGYASHGCIAGPDQFVEKIFAATRPGDKVIITRGATMGLGDSIV